MSIRLPSISKYSRVPSNGFAICNSRGRRVSLLNDDEESFIFPSCIESSPVQHCPLSYTSSYSRCHSLFSVNSRRASTQLNQSRGNKRRYECPTCRKTFTTSGHVARHKRIHTGEKKFQCPEPGCAQRFSRHDNCMYEPSNLTHRVTIYRQHYRTHKGPATLRHVRPCSAQKTAPLNSSHRNKRTPNKEASEESVDPNDRLSAFATYISAYA